MSEKNQFRTPVIVLAVSSGILALWDLFLGFNGATTIVTLFALIALSGASIYWLRAESTPSMDEDNLQEMYIPLATRLRLAADGNRDARLEVASILISLARDKGIDETSIRKLAEQEPSLGSYVRSPPLFGTYGPSRLIKIRRREKNDYLSSVASVLDRLGELG